MATAVSDADERPLKRARPADDAPSQEPAYKFVEDQTVWMDDGNVIIAAGNEPVHLFKCHRSVLCKNSEMMNDMFGVPFSCDQHQGVPIVPMPDDVDDVRALLKMLYDPVYVYLCTTRTFLTIQSGLHSSFTPSTRCRE